MQQEALILSLSRQNSLLNFPPVTKGRKLKIEFVFNISYRLRLFKAE